MSKPYGGEKLVNAIPGSESERNLLTSEALKSFKHLRVPDRFLSDCEMLAIGAFTPLNGFMNRDDVDSVVKNCSLPNGLIWGVPIVLPVSKEEASSIKVKDKLALLEKSGNLIAVMEVTDKFEYPRESFCKEVFKTTETAHPGVAMMMENADVFLSGPVKLLNRPSSRNVDGSYYLDPVHTREEFAKRGWKTVVAFQTRNPIHRAHEYLIKCALESVDGALVHPLVGETKSDDIAPDVRMKCYEVLIKNYFNSQRIVLSVLPAFMRYAGPREALNHAIIRKNYGCTHFIIGRDHAGVGNYYHPFEAQELLTRYSDHIGIQPVKFDNSFYCKACKDMATAKTCPHSPDNHLQLSGTKVRSMLKEGVRPPEEFSRPEVVDILIECMRS